MKFRKEFLGEFIGTFFLVLFGCGSVGMSVLFNAFSSLFQIGIIWGIGVTLAIYATRHLSGGHLNPAVSIAMAANHRLSLRKLPTYLFAQFAGAAIAGLVLYLLLNPSILSYENANQIVRGSSDSMLTAKMFGEYYQLPGATSVVSMPLAMGAEALGTAILVFMIFSLTEGCNEGKPDNNAAPLFIGLTVTSLLCLIAPISQAGLNPARDFGPRLVAWLSGWGAAAFPDHSGGFFLVYILSPILGGLIAGWFFVHVVLPNMNGTKEKSVEKYPLNQIQGVPGKLTLIHESEN